MTIIPVNYFCRVYPDEERGDAFTVVAEGIKKFKYLFDKSNTESPSKSERYNLEALPNELHLEILQQLDLEELLSMRLVNRHWKELASDNTLWARIASRLGWDQTTFSTVSLRISRIYAHHKEVFVVGAFPPPKKILHINVLRAELYLHDISELMKTFAPVRVEALMAHAHQTIQPEDLAPTSALQLTLLGWNLGIAHAVAPLINFLHQGPAQPPLAPQYVQPDERYLELDETRSRVVRAAKDLKDAIQWHPQQIARITILDLNGKYLSSLPEEVLLFPQLQEIHLQHNPHLELSTTMLQALASRNIHIFR